MASAAGIADIPVVLVPTGAVAARAASAPLRSRPSQVHSLGCPRVSLLSPPSVLTKSNSDLHGS